MRAWVINLIILTMLTACSRVPEKPVTLLANPKIPTENPSPLSLKPTSIAETSIVVPVDAILFEENFEREPFSGISIDAGEWKVEKDGKNNHIFCDTSVDYNPTLTFGYSWWTNYAVEILVKPQQMKPGQYVILSTRYDFDTGSGYYGSFNNFDYYYDFSSWPPYESFSHGTIQPSLDNWYKLRIEVFGDQIKFFINDQLLGYGENSQYSKGEIKLHTSQRTQICIDDIRVWNLDGTGKINKVPQSIHPDFETVAIDAQAWGPHLTKITRTRDGVFVVYEVASQNESENHWRLVKRQDNGSWLIIAEGEAGGDETNLLAEPDGNLIIIAWPDKIATIWSGKPEGNQILLTIETIPDLDFNNDGYSAAGIDIEGNFCIFATFGGKSSYFALACHQSAEGNWIIRKVMTDYRYCYAYVFPNPQGGVSLVATRDVLWNELGYQNPPGSFDYMFNKFIYWSSNDVKQVEITELFSKEELPTSDFPFVTLNAEHESYLDTNGNMHIFYVIQAENTNGWNQYRIAIISSSGRLLHDVRLPYEFGYYNRIFQDSAGQFYIISSSGYLLPAGNDGVTFGNPIKIDMHGYTVEYPGMAISAPRTGTPISNAVEVVFPTEDGSKWIYFQLDLPEK